MGIVSGIGIPDTCMSGVAGIPIPATGSSETIVKLWVLYRESEFPIPA